MSEAAGVADTLRGAVREALGAPWTAWVTYLVVGISSAWLFTYVGAGWQGALPLTALLEGLAQLQLGPTDWLQTFAEWFGQVGSMILPALWLGAAAFLLIGTTYANTSGLQAALGQLLLLLSCEAAGSLWPYAWVLLVGAGAAVAARIATVFYHQAGGAGIPRSAANLAVNFALLTIAPLYLLVLLWSTIYRILHYDTE